jgi:hypothetical protein
MPDSQHQNPDHLDEAEELVKALSDRLAQVVPTKLCAPGNRQPLAESFVDLLGRLVEFLEAFKPMNHGQMAALLFFVDNLKLDHVGADAAFVMTTLVDAARRASRDMRRLRAS